MNKACWTGYVQRGMKEKNGRMVPNCVPVKKAMQDDLENFIKEMKEKYSSKEVK
jgi:signal recognition particle subunit SEC65